MQGRLKYSKETEAPKNFCPTGSHFKLLTLSSLVHETGEIALVQVCTEANQFASAIDLTGTIENLLKIAQAKVSFFLKTQKRLVF